MLPSNKLRVLFDQKDISLYLLNRMALRYFFFLFFVSFHTWANPVRVKLYEINAETEGALVTKWEELSDNSQGASTNRIFVAGLPDATATGDTWEGVVERSGAYTMANGLKIPRYVVANSQAEVDKNTNITKFDIENDVFLVKTDSGRGSAFKCLMDGKSYIVTNLHVVDGTSNIEIHNHKGINIALPAKAEICKDADLLRFLIGNEGGLEIQPEVALGEAAVVYGNSQGSDVVTELKGKVLGVGPTTFEVSCPFVTGNSGGPVVGKSGKVMGVASFLTLRENKWDQKTRFSEVRRFAINLQTKQSWISVPLSVFQKESKILAESNQSLEQVMDLAFLYGNSFIGKIKISASDSNRRKAQGKVDLAVDSFNNSRLTENQKCWLFFGSLAEACEAIPEENRVFWSTEWSQNRYKQISDLAKEYAVQIRAFREEVGRALKSLK